MAKESLTHFYERINPKPSKHWVNMSKCFATYDFELEDVTCTKHPGKGILLNGGWGPPMFRVRKTELAGQACFVVEEDQRQRRHYEKGAL